MDQKVAEGLVALWVAVDTGRRAEARTAAAALRHAHPTEVEGWLWGAWLAETPTAAQHLATHAAQLDSSAATDEALAWAHSQGEGTPVSPLTDEQLRALASRLPTLRARPSREAGVTALLEAEPAPPPSETTPSEAVPPEVSRLPARSEMRSGLRGPRYGAVLLGSFLVLALLAGLLLLDGARGGSRVAGFFAPQPELALKEEAGRLWVAGDRLAALERWQAAHRLAPDNPDIAESLARAHVAVAGDFLRADQPDAALPNLEAALRLLPDEAVVVNEYEALRAYLTGRDAVHAGQWTAALEALMPLHNMDPRYLDVATLVGTAVAGQAQAAQEEAAQGTLALQAALQAEPGRAARTAFAPTEISNLPGQTTMPSLGPMAPASDKHIVVSINAQRMYVYENGQLLWDWTASTGEAARPTIPGRYRIQSKIENARSNVWSLWMPSWQGLYWAGSVENGIHGQVTFDSGGRLWEGYLGTRITFGCVMISDEHASTLFNWTEMGTPVSIHWDWDPAQVPNENGDPL